MREVHPADRQHHFRRQLFVALEAAVGERGAHRYFDLALRGDADFLEKSAQAGVEGVFVHDGLLVFVNSFPASILRDARQSALLRMRSAAYCLYGVLTMVSLKLRWARSALAAALPRCTSRFLRQAT